MEEKAGGFKYDARTAADLFREIADLLELLGEEPFKAPAYRRAAAVIQRYAAEIPRLAEEGQLTSLPGIGEILARKVNEILSTGTVELLERLRSRVPPGVQALLGVPGLGPRTVATLWRAGVEDLDTLEEMAATGRLRQLPGFGPQKEKAILEAIATVKRQGGLWLGEAWVAAKEISARLETLAGVERVEPAGFVRRAAWQVPQLEFVVVREADSVDPDLDLTDLAAELGKMLGVPVHIYVTTPERFGAVLLWATGGEMHLAELAPVLTARGLLLGPEGLLRRVASSTPEGKGNGTADHPADSSPDLPSELVVTPDEESVYRYLGLAPIPPELRDRPGMVDLAAKGQVPRLVELADIQGDLHVHTSWSDGRASLAEMARAAATRGLRYLAVTDHSASLRVANGLEAERLKLQWEELDRTRSAFPELELLRGIEIEIRTDGQLDYDEEIRSRFQWVNASIHTGFSSDAAQIRRRLLAAMKDPATCAISHPTGRRLGMRRPYALTLEHLLEDALATGVALEINCSPERLDLSPEWAEAAFRAGVPLTISTDSHSPDGMAVMELGVRLARRAGLPPEAILNAQPLSVVREHAERRRSAAGR
ncbi:MAG: hypothetical protein IMX00_08570 [Limnochordales bacterium]|nr:hypothetical protein [Limnochordales bacterium]